MASWLGHAVLMKNGRVLRAVGGGLVHDGGDEPIVGAVRVRAAACCLSLTVEAVTMARVPRAAEAAGGQRASMPRGPSVRVAGGAARLWPPGRAACIGPGSCASWVCRYELCALCYRFYRRAPRCGVGRRWRGASLCRARGRGRPAGLRRHPQQLGTGVRCSRSTWRRSSRAKVATIARHGGPVPGAPMLCVLIFDLRAQALGRCPRRAGFAVGGPTFFGWEDVPMYLTRAARHRHPRRRARPEAQRVGDPAATNVVPRRRARSPREPPGRGAPAR